MSKKIFKRTIEVFGISEEDFISSSRKRDLVEARCAYALVLETLGLDMNKGMALIDKARVMSYHYPDKAKAKFKVSLTFANKVKQILKDDDKYNQLRSEYTYMPADSLQKLIPPPKPKVYFTGKQGKTLHSFNFSDEETARINQACWEAEEYMKEFGKGISRMPIVDYRRYN